MPAPVHTGHPDVDDVIARIREGMVTALGPNLIALWLTGSLTYGDFDHGSSDIDYCAVIERPLDADERQRLTTLHEEIGAYHPTWRERIEGTYVMRDMLAYREPPPMGRPYVNGGQFWEPDPPYGNEWLLNLHVLRESGFALVGPEPAALIDPIPIEEVRAASSRDLFDERLRRPTILPHSRIATRRPT